MRTAQECSIQRIPNKLSLARIVGGIAVACVMAMICFVVWLFISLVTYSTLGVLAIPVGLLIGLAAGCVAGNRSLIYCSLVSLIAVLCILAVKIVTAAVIMNVYIYEFDNLAWSDAAIRDTHVLVDQMLADGKLEGPEKEYAELYVSSYFFENVSWSDVSDELWEAGERLEHRLLFELKSLPLEQRKQLVIDAKQRHPEWIVDKRHYFAAVDQMLQEENTLTPELKAHAAVILWEIDRSVIDDEYDESTSEAEKESRTAQLRKLAADRINAMTTEQRDQLVRDALKRHPAWNAFPDALIAKLVEMDDNQAFKGKIAEHVKVMRVSDFIYDENFVYPQEYDEMSSEEYDARDQSLTIRVNQELSKMDLSARDSLIAETRKKYPEWIPSERSAEEDFHEFNEAVQRLEAIGGDGTFDGSLRSLFTILDLISFLLGTILAFLVPLLLGMFASRKTVGTI